MGTISVCFGIKVVWEERVEELRELSSACFSHTSHAGLLWNFFPWTFVWPHWPSFDQETVGFLLSSVDYTLWICEFWPGGEGINLSVSLTDGLVDFWNWLSGWVVYLLPIFFLKLYGKTKALNIIHLHAQPLADILALFIHKRKQAWEVWNIFSCSEDLPSELSS